MTAMGFALVKAIALASHLVPLVFFCGFAVGKWRLAPLMIAAVLVVAAIRLYAWGFLQEDRAELERWNERRGAGGWCPCLDLFSARAFASVGPYLQASLWQTILIAALALRPVYFLSEVEHWRQSSPCGRSSCSRDWSPALLGGTPLTVYNPTGWFPQGGADDTPAYDPHGVDEYVFCDFQDSCRWADDNWDVITTYDKLRAGCELNYDAPRDDEAGFASRRARDYPNPGTGIEGGWSVCGRADLVLPCPGNMRQETCGLSAAGVACNDTAVPSKRVWKGKRVCATCSNYENAYKSLLLGVDGYPQWQDPEVACAEKDDINPLCFVCPTRDEVLTPDVLRAVVGFYAWMALDGLFCAGLVAAHAFATRASMSAPANAVPVPVAVPAVAASVPTAVPVGAPGAAAAKQLVTGVAGLLSAPVLGWMGGGGAPQRATMSESQMKIV
jgi:hypothetical protein